MRKASMAFLGGVAAVALMFGSARLGGSSALAQPAGGAVVPVRVATIDPFIVIEKLMTAAEPTQTRERVVATFDDKLRALEADLQGLERELQGLAANDPKSSDIVARGQAKQTEYQQLQTQRQTELERVNSNQLIESYGRVSETAARIATERGYTHVVASRNPSRPITTTTIAATLQELLARPVMKSMPGDDLTAAVAGALGVTLDEAAK